MARTLLLAVSACLLALSDGRSICSSTTCPTNPAACCFNDMLLNEEEATCSNATYTCGLCGQAEYNKCPVCPSDVTPFEKDGGKNPFWCTEPVFGAAAGGAFGAAVSFPIVLKRTDGSSTALATFNGMKGWEDLDDSKFLGFQEFLLGLTAQLPHWTQRSNFEVSLRCDEETIGMAEGCSLFIFVYRCPPCAAHTGNIEEQILAETDPVWSVNPCGPVFMIHPEGVTHQFALYSTEVTAPFTFSILLEQDIAFTWWALVGQQVVCSSISTEADCNANPVNCVWDDVAGQCAVRGCVFHGGQTGPGLPRCTVCVDDELQPDPSTPYTN